MTDRHSGYVVVLKDDIREDDAERVIDAIQMIKGVLTVKPVTSGEPNWVPETIVATRRDTAWRGALRDLAIAGPPAE
jgi:hypothetical protein